MSELPFSLPGVDMVALEALLGMAQTREVTWNEAAAISSDAVGMILVMQECMAIRLLIQSAKEVTR